MCNNDVAREISITRNFLIDPRDIFFHKFTYVRKKESFQAWKDGEKGANYIWLKTKNKNHSCDNNTDHFELFL